LPANSVVLIVLIFVFTFFALIVFVIFWQSWLVVRAVANFFLKDYINRHLIFRKLNPSSKKFLEDNFKYYQRLSNSDKVIFERRVQKFISMKEFVSRGELKVVTREMKTLIAASAIQITFGLPSIYFRHFYRILIYPDAYYSNITKHYHRGEVNSTGLIVLSWKNLVNGYLDDTDGRNLGLHEMAHALKIADSIQNEEEYDFMDSGTYSKFISEARLEMQKIAIAKSSFFRDYAATNDYEFFAVAIESFFERPKAFYEYNQKLYELLCELLNQNPLTYQEK
jgi:Mlc titration factor MtfA (ptsG expression regulator)